MAQISYPEAAYLSAVCRWSFVSWLLCAMVILGTGILYYPKWEQGRTEATLSWDVSGYYYYLPALFIYHDLKTLSFSDEIREKYYPTPDLQQARQQENGDYVLKYSAGMAVQYLPFFAVGHLWASISDHPPDGFSLPYQMAISIGSLLVALIGLWLLRKLLLIYFTDRITGAVLLAFVFGTNYLDYTAINGAMTHNYLFTWYCALILCTINFWKKPSRAMAVVIGGIIGIMVLTRPSEMVAALIPFLWGVDSRVAWKQRLSFITGHRDMLVRALLAMALVGAIQVVYWLYATGSPLVYSYEHGFKFFKPKLINGLFNFRIGWLTYSPILIFALIGFYFLYKNHKRIFPALAIFFAVNLWLVLSWSDWTYGGSLGHRAMIQSYPVLAFGMAACIERLWKKNWGSWLFGVALVICTLYNTWLTHHAHRGDLFRPGQMTKAYFWQVIGKQSVPTSTQLLLDNKDMYNGSRGNIQIVTEISYESPEFTSCTPPLKGDGSLCIDPYSEVMLYTLQSGDLPTNGMLRATATFRAPSKEWTWYNMPIFATRIFQADELSDNEKQVRKREIRLFRVLEPNETMQLHVDMKLPRRKPFNNLEVYLDNTSSPVPLQLDDLKVEFFDPE